MAAGLLDATRSGAGDAPAGATMFVHSAGSGERRGSRLTLRGPGIGGRVTCVHSSSRSGVVSVATTPDAAR